MVQDNDQRSPVVHGLETRPRRKIELQEREKEKRRHSAVQCRAVHGERSKGRDTRPWPIRGRREGRGTRPPSPTLLSRGPLPLTPLPSPSSLPFNSSPSSSLPSSFSLLQAAAVSLVDEVQWRVPRRVARRRGAAKVGSPTPVPLQGRRAQDFSKPEFSNWPLRPKNK